MSDDMQTMPVRELITAIRKKTAGDTLPILTAMLLNVLVNRLEQEANRADELETAIRRADRMKPSNTVDYISKLVDEFDNPLKLVDNGAKEF